MHRYVIAAMAVLFALAPAQAQNSQPAPDQPEARRIMQMVNDRDDGDNMTMEQEMILVDKRGNQRVRLLKSYAKDFGKDTYHMMFFLDPPDVRDTAFLTYDYGQDGKDDDQWLYLPAFRKVKRIAVSDKDGSFMGSDFYYGDMTRRELSKYDFQMIQEDTVHGQKCWVIQCMPRSRDVVDEYGYKKSLVWVRQDVPMMVRGKFWVKSGHKVKLFDVPKIEKIDGILTATEMTMTTKKGDRTEHHTILRNKNIHYNQNLDANLFTTTRMETGAMQ